MAIFVRTIPVRLVVDRFCFNKEAENVIGHLRKTVKKKINL
jgi:ribosomal protein L31E